MIRKFNATYVPDSHTTGVYTQELIEKVGEKLAERFGPLTECKWNVQSANYGKYGWNLQISSSLSPAIAALSDVINACEDYNFNLLQDEIGTMTNIRLKLIDLEVSEIANERQWFYEMLPTLNLDNAKTREEALVHESAAKFDIEKDAAWQFYLWLKALGKFDESE